MPCKATRADGEPCQAPESVIGDDGYCVAHRPGDEHKEVASRGGRATAKKLRKPPASDRDVPPTPETIEDAKRWLAWVATNLANGMLDQKEARSLSYTLRAFMDSVEKADVQDELEELKDKIAALQKGELEAA